MLGKILKVFGNDDYGGFVGILIVNVFIIVEFYIWNGYSGIFGIICMYILIK